MLKKFRVENYKNFKNPIIIDFSKTAGYQFNAECITDHIISKMIIYGRNSTGKTNIGKALMDITQCLQNRRLYGMSDGFLVNADSDSKYVKFVYIFAFNEKELEYSYSKTNDNQLYDEALYWDGKKVFSCNLFKHEIDFKNLDLLNADTVNIDRYLEALAYSQDDEEVTKVPPFLRWLINNAVLPSGSPLLAMDKFVNNMHMQSTSNFPFGFGRKILPRMFYEKMSSEIQLMDFQNFLNTMGVPCELICEKMPDGQYQLYFKHDVLLPFAEVASSGTLALAELYGRLQFGRYPSLIFMDEFDAFYHYEMSEKVVEYLKHKYPNCQFIFTTHNTNLMSNRLFRPDCLFILSSHGKLTPLYAATSRELREGHNLEKMYISGEFDRYE